MVHLSMVVLANENYNKRCAYFHHACCRGLGDPNSPSWLSSFNANEFNKVSLSSYVDTTETKLPFLDYSGVLFITTILKIKLLTQIAEIKIVLLSLKSKLKMGT